MLNYKYDVRNSSMQKNEPKTPFPGPQFYMQRLDSSLLHL